MKRVEFTAGTLQEAQMRAAVADIEHHNMHLLRAFFTRQTDGTYLVNLTYQEESHAEPEDTEA